MKHLEALVSREIAEKLYHGGLSPSMTHTPTYAEAFDALLEKGVLICVVPKQSPAQLIDKETGLIPDPIQQKWNVFINGTVLPVLGTWEEAAEAGIFHSVPIENLKSLC